jgi:hypothetical protein
MRGVRLLGPAFLLAAFAVPLVGIRTSAAQTLFEWPPVEVDVSKYTTIDECSAAVSRGPARLGSADSLAALVWRDTMPFDPAERMRPVPSAVVEAARACLASVAPDPETVPVEEYGALVPLYLMADWEEKARTLVERRIAAVRPGADDTLVAVLDTVIAFFAGAFAGTPPRYGVSVRPPRPILLEELAASHLSRVGDRVKRLRKLFELNIVWDAIHDTARARNTGQQISVLLDSLTHSERDTLVERSRQMLVTGEETVLRLSSAVSIGLGRERLLDSLRHSTEAYVRATLGGWSRVFGQPPEALPFFGPIGDRAPVIEGDVWLGCEGDQCQPRPRPGRISLVVFLSHGSCVGVIRGAIDMYGNCAQQLTTLRRLHERFPELDITVVARTYGYFGYLKEGVTLETEAELTRRWLDSAGLERVVLAMTDAPYWRLPHPDGRRVAERTTNEANYTFGERWKVRPSEAYLIDENGIIVARMQMLRENMPGFVELIEILFQRQHPEA